MVVNSGGSLRRTILGVNIATTQVLFVRAPGDTAEVTVEVGVARPSRANRFDLRTSPPTEEA